MKRILLILLLLLLAGCRITSPLTGIIYDVKPVGIEKGE